MEPEEREYPDSLDKDIRYLQVLVAHYTHHDRLLWGRLNIIFGIQAAVIGGGWALKDSYLEIAVGFIVTGCLLSLIWLYVFNRDLQARDENRVLISEISKRVSKGFGLDSRFTLGKAPETLLPFPDDYNSRLLGFIYNRFDRGIFLWVPTRSVILMRMALTLLFFLDISLICYLFFFFEPVAPVK